MKIKFLMIGLLGLVSATAFAQKGALKDAQEAYDQYDIAKAGGALLAPKAKGNLDDAKTAIDKAAANEKTDTLAQTYADAEPRGEIVLVAGPAPEAEPDLSGPLDAFRRLVESGAKRRTAATVVAELTGVSANALYRAFSGSE